MKKLIIIPILLSGVLFSGCVNNNIVVSDSKSMTLLADELQVSQPIFSPISDSQDGVDVMVEDVKKENGKTIVKLVLNNHRYDLLAMDVKSNSNFSGVKPVEYIIESSAMGGHHVQAKMVFNGDLSGLLVIDLNGSLVFNFNL